MSLKIIFRVNHRITCYVLCIHKQMDFFRISDIDCGLPMPVPHGHWMLPSNTTHYGSQVEYVCDSNFEIHGPGRRICLENATWSSNEPSCEGMDFKSVFLSTYVFFIT